MNASVASVQVSSADGVGWLALDNPTKHNAISLAMWGQLRAALDAFAADPVVLCVVIRGQGEHAFCAGADLGEKDDLDAAHARRDSEATLGHLRAMRAFPKPLLAMIAGHCLGAGVGIAISCDIRIASSDARLGVPAAKLGLGFHYDLVKALTDLVGPGRAKQILFTADRVGAERALQIGLVDEVVTSGALLEATRAMAVRIAANAPLTIAAAKAAVAASLEDPPGQAHTAVRELAWACLKSEDYAEGRAAFKQKRAPRFKGH